MNRDYSIESLGAAAYWKWLLTAMISSAVAVAGLVTTVAHPNRHPLIFACCLFWAVALVVSAVTRDGLMRMDPISFRFVRWEREGRLYHKLGVSAFRWLLLHTPLGWLDPKLKFDSRRSGVEPMLREMNFAEGAHWIGGAVTFGFASCCFATGQMKIGGTLVILTIVFHIYPVILQRWNRGRFLRLARRWDAKHPLTPNPALQATASTQRG